MSFDYIVNGDYGQVAKITFYDVDTNAAADISGYASTIQMIFTDPDGTETEKTATFDTDGTDGVIKYTIETGLFNQSGHWKVRGRVKGAAATLSTVDHKFYIEK